MTLVGATVPSVASLLESPIVTLAVGWLVSTSVNVAWPPASVVTSPEVGVTVIPEASLSRLLTVTLGGLMPLYAGSLLTAAAVVML